MNDDDKVARNRLLVIGLVRLSGVIFVALGVLVLRDVLDLPDIAGYALIGIGLIETFIAPQILARQWRSGGE